MSKYQAYPEYKDSGVEWLGEMPSHWRVIPIKHLADLNPKKSAIDHTLLNKECNFLPMEKLKLNSIVLDEKRLVSDIYDGYTYFEDGDVLMAKVTPCFENKNIAVACGLVNGVGFGSSEIYVLRSNEKTDNRFLYYRLQEDSFMDIATAAMTGAGGLKRVPSDVVNGYSLGTPEADEQTKIANFLDHETAKIDTLIDKQQKLIKLLKEKRQAVISHAVTKGLNPDAPMKDSGVEWLGDVPEHWEVKAIKFALKSLDYRRIPLSSEERGKRSGDYRYYGASGVIDHIDSFIFDESTVLVGEDGANLLTRNTPLAFSAHGKYWVNNHAHILKPTDDLADYWAEVLELIDVTPIVSGSAQPKLTAEALNNLTITFPPCVDERKEIDKFIKNQKSTYDALTSKAISQVSLLKERRTALISAAVTGKIDVRNWQVPEKKEQLEAS